MKQTFSDKKTPFPDRLRQVRWSVPQFCTPSPKSGDTPMIRRRLLIATAIVASVVLTACSDMTAPKNDTTCPMSNGSQICSQ
jgi:hypothetical protein